MEINPEIRERILAAAGQLFEASGRKDLPTVDSVRKLSKTNMNDASAVMKEWRRLQIVSASVAVVSVPDKVAQASASALGTLWAQAQELASEALTVAQAAWDAERGEAEKLRVELSVAFEAQGAELEALRVRVSQIEKEAAAAAAAAERVRVESARQVAGLTDQAHTALARAQEIEKRAEDLKAGLEMAQKGASAVTLELEAERSQHGVSRGQVEALGAELATVKARAEAQGVVQAGLTDRLKAVEGELAQAREATGAAREEAARLTGQAEALKAQQAELMRVIEARKVEQPQEGPK